MTASCFYDPQYCSTQNPTKSVAARQLLNNRRVLSALTGRGIGSLAWNLPLRRWNFGDLILSAEVSSFKTLYVEIEAQLGKTARFVPAAFHVHSIASHDWGERAIADPGRNAKHQFEGEAGQSLFLDELAREFDVVCITDHMKVGYAVELSKASMKRDDILVLPGMEIGCRITPFQECIHLLAIFPPGHDLIQIERIFASNGGFPGEDARNGKERFDCGNDLTAWVETVTLQGGFVVIAHIDSNNGHRKVIRAACEGTLEAFLHDGDGISIDDRRAISEEYKTLLARSGARAVEIKRGSDKDHYVSFTHGTGNVCRMPCVIRSDAHCVEEFGRHEHKTYIKIARRDFAAVSDAISFSDTRIRFHDDLPAIPSPRLLGLRLSSPSGKGFFDEATVAFNPNLNCIIGPRGSGKSTIAEALRYVLGANQEYLPGIDKSTSEFGFQDLARKIQKTNLQETLIEVLYQTVDDGIVVLSATFDAQSDVTTDVFDLDGNKRIISPQALLTRFPVRLYSWSEIEALGRRPELQRAVVDCLIPQLPDLLEARENTYRQLQANRRAVLAKCAELKNKLQEERAVIQHYTEYKADFERINTPEVAALFEQLDHARRKSEVLLQVRQEIIRLDQSLSEIDTSLLAEIEQTVSEDTTGDLQNWWANVISPQLLLIQLGDTAQERIQAIQETLRSRIVALDSLIEAQNEETEETEAGLRERTQTSAEDEIKRGTREHSLQRYTAAETKRSEYLGLWQQFESHLDLRARLIDELQAIHQQISSLRESSQGALNTSLRELDPFGLRISISYGSGKDRADAIAYMRDEGFLRSDPFGHYKDRHIAERCLRMATPTTVARAILKQDVSLFETDGQSLGTNDCLTRSEAELITSYYWPFRDELGASVTSSDEEKLKRVMELQERRWEDSLRILLDDKPVDERSPGQRSSAMLPLIALSEKVPLIIDQPEDNLDNLLVGNVLPRILAQLKENRQIIAATHSPNIVVGGDAEQVIVVHADGARSASIEATGSIDDDKIVKSVIEIMEGGKEAFETRARRYKPHIGLTT